MDKYPKVQAALKFSINAGTNLLENNSTYRTYCDLHNQLLKYDNIDTFLNDHTVIKNHHTEFLTYILNHTSYNRTDKIPNYHLLGSHMEEIIPNFCKEEKKDPSITNEQHVIKWFERNSGLDYESTKDIVQAGFLTLFFL
jgi:hypothetical protein